eukprot:4956239-Amphidinium_carterae.1
MKSKSHSPGFMLAGNLCQQRVTHRHGPHGMRWFSKPNCYKFGRYGKWIMVLPVLKSGLGTYGIDWN